MDEKKLKKRSANDVLSHLKRANTIIDVFDEQNDIEYIEYLLSINKNYKKLSPSVKSQLKRAIRLYLTFANEYKNRVNYDLFDN